MTHVVQFGRLPMPGGYSIERVFEEIRRELPRGYSIEVIGCPTPWHSKLWLLQGLMKAWKNRNQLNHVIGDVHYVALGLPPERTLLTVHDLNRLDDLKGIRRAAYKLLYFDVPLRRCRYVTAISPATRDRLVSMFPDVADKVFVIPDCYSKAFGPRPKEFNSTCPRILQIGTKPNKNLNRVISALQDVRCVLHVIGKLSDSQRALLETLQIDYEHEMNVLDEAIVRAYENSDVVLFASLSEGFGLPIIEANLVGRVVVTSNISPMKEVAGNAACLVDPQDVNDIRRGICRVVEDATYRSELIDRGIENAKRYSPETIACEYARVYQQVEMSAAT